MTKTFKDVKGIEEACWVGYKKVGMKKKGDRMVPNCVKEEVVDSLLGADYIYENVADMYKGQFSKAQLAKMKQTWATKKASDLTPSVKNFVKGLDQFSQMDIKNANIKYISALIEEVEKGEVELVHKFQNVVEENQMRASIRKSEDLKEFSTDQIERLAKAYSVMKDRTISVANAQKLGKMMDGVPDSSLNAIRKKKIPFLSGLALSRMIQKKIPVTESTYEDKEDLQEFKKMTVTFKSMADMSKASTDLAKQGFTIDAKGMVMKVDGKGADLNKYATDLKNFHGATIKAEETDLSKSQIKKVHKQADDLPKKDFMKRYGKDGDSVRYATATNMVKKKLGLGESNFIKKGELKMNDTYKQRLTSAMEHFNISSLGELNEDDHKIFFTYVDDMKEGLSAAQKKLPAGLQKAILAKQGKKDEMHDMKKDKKEVKEDLVGGQKKLDKDKDGDLDAKDFAMLRKGKSEMKSMKKEYGSMMAMKMKKEEKTKETDSEPKTKDLNAMMNMTAMKAKPMNAMKDMNAMYMKSNVKAAVMNNGGSDMAKVKDAPDMKDAMKKINATYGMKKENNGRYLQTKPGSLEEAVLKSRGLVK